CTSSGRMHHWTSVPAAIGPPSRARSTRPTRTTPGERTRPGCTLWVLLHKGPPAGSGLARPPADGVGMVGVAVTGQPAVRARTDVRRSSWTGDQSSVETAVETVGAWMEGSAL